MLNDEIGKAQYTTPSIKEYGSVSDLVGTNFDGSAANDGSGAGYTS